MRTASLLLATLGAALWFGFAQQASAELVDNGDTTITDTQSGLMWLKYPLSARPYIAGQDQTVNWPQANQEIANLNTYTAPGGFRDWRLPRSPAEGNTILRALHRTCAAQGQNFGSNCWGPFDVGPPNVGRTFWTSQEQPSAGGDMAMVFGTLLIGGSARSKENTFIWAWAVRGGKVPQNRSAVFVGTKSEIDGESMIKLADAHSGKIYRAFVSPGNVGGISIAGDTVYLLSSSGVTADITQTDHWGVVKAHFSVTSLVDTPSALESLTRNRSSGQLILGYSKLVASGEPSKLLFVNPTNGALVSSVPLVNPSQPSPFQVRHAVGLDVDDQGTIYVLTNDGRIQSYNPQGDRLQSELETDIFRQNLDTTLGLALTGDGFLIVGAMNNMIYKVDRAGGIVERFPAPGVFPQALDIRPTTPTSLRPSKVNVWLIAALISIAAIIAIIAARKKFWR